MADDVLVPMLLGNVTWFAQCSMLSSNAMNAGRSHTVDALLYNCQQQPAGRHFRVPVLVSQWRRRHGEETLRCEGAQRCPAAWRE
jgi:hypothetical protein